jgi:hypothetical protein
LNTTYHIDKDIVGNIPSLPLFRGSPYKAKDLARFLLSFKARHLKVGDGILANVVAMLATFLPNDNAFKKLLPNKTSIYMLLKAVDNVACFHTNLRTLKIHYCTKKCMGFYGPNADINFCSMCDVCRWKSCTRMCFGESNEKLCVHNLNPKKCLYYNVVQDRLVKLLKSDLKNLFEYESHRAGMS